MLEVASSLHAISTVGPAGQRCQKQTWNARSQSSTGFHSSSLRVDALTSHRNQPLSRGSRMSVTAKRSLACRWALNRGRYRPGHLSWPSGNHPSPGAECPRRRRAEKGECLQKKALGVTLNMHAFADSFFPDFVGLDLRFGEATGREPLALKALAALQIVGFSDHGEAGKRVCANSQRGKRHHHDNARLRWLSVLSQARLLSGNAASGISHDARVSICAPDPSHQLTRGRGGGVQASMPAGGA